MLLRVVALACAAGCALGLRDFGATCNRTVARRVRDIVRDEVAHVATALQLQLPADCPLAQQNDVLASQVRESAR